MARPIDNVVNKLVSTLPSRNLITLIKLNNLFNKNNIQKMKTKVFKPIKNVNIFIKK